MSKKIKQFIYGEDVTQEELIKDTFLQDKGVGDSVLQLGIQGLPGTKFYLNGNLYPIILDASGVFYIEAKNGARISSLKFEPASIEKISGIKNDFAYLIIDVLIDEEKED